MMVVVPVTLISGVDPGWKSETVSWMIMSFAPINFFVIIVRAVAALLRLREDIAGANQGRRGFEMFEKE